MSTDSPKKARVLSYVMDGPVRYRVQCIPAKHQLLAGGTFEERLGGVLIGKRVDRVFAPAVAHMSAQHALRSDFSERQTILPTTDLLRTAVPSDLVDLQPQEGLFFPSRGCLLVMATGGEYCIGGHAGLRSLIRLPGEKRENESVVHAIVRYFDSKGIAAGNIVLRGFFGIQPHVFPHDPQHPTKGVFYAPLVERLTRLQEVVRKNKKWTEYDHIVTYTNGIPHVNLYFALKALAFLQGITRVGCEKPLPANDDNFGCTRHTNPDMVHMDNWVLAYRET